MFPMFFKNNSPKVCVKHESCGVYGIGMIGALVYNMQYATSFSEVLYGLFKTLAWPAFLVYQLLTLLV